MIRHTSILLTTILVLLALTSCTNKNAQDTSEQRRATVSMQDGTKVKGTVQASSPSEITLVGDDHVTRTIPMNQVKSVAYSAPPVGSQKPRAAINPIKPSPRQPLTNSPREPRSRSGVTRRSIPARQLRGRPLPPKSPRMCSTAPAPWPSRTDQTPN